MNKMNKGNEKLNEWKYDKKNCKIVLFPLLTLVFCWPLLSANFYYIF